MLGSDPSAESLPQASALGSAAPPAAPSALAFHQHAINPGCLGAGPHHQPTSLESRFIKLDTNTQSATHAEPKQWQMWTVWDERICDNLKYDVDIGSEIPLDFFASSWRITIAGERVQKWADAPNAAPQT
jgi:hypothetical protein